MKSGIWERPLEKKSLTCCRLSMKHTRGLTVATITLSRPNRAEGQDLRHYLRRPSHHPVNQCMK